MRERPRFDENQIAHCNEFNARAARGKIPACVLVVRFIVICGELAPRAPYQAGKLIYLARNSERFRPGFTDPGHLETPPRLSGSARSFLLPQYVKSFYLALVLSIV